eukprot:scaffold8375_cov33-Tisochrysis_lutea.AAC.3
MELTQLLVGKGSKGLRQGIHLDGWVHWLQMLDHGLRLVAPDVGGAKGEGAANSEVVRRHSVRILDRDVPHARKHKVLGRLVTQSARSQQQHARAEQAALGVEAPQPDLPVVPLDI